MHGLGSPPWMPQALRNFITCHYVVNFCLETIGELKLQKLITKHKCDYDPCASVLVLEISLDALR